MYGLRLEIPDQMQVTSKGGFLDEDGDYRSTKLLPVDSFY